MTALKQLGSRMARGAAWMVLYRLIDRLLGVINTLILARLLTPADFGLVAMATAFIAVLELMTAFSFDVALIQKRDAEREHYDSAWTLNVIVSSALGLAMVVAAPWVADFFREEAVRYILYALAISVAAWGFENIGIVAFRKELAFRKEFMYLATRRVLAISITIALAFATRSYWALVAGMVAGRLIGVVLSYVVHPFRPRFCLKHARHLLHFSKWMVANSAMVLINSRAADFFLGRMSGARQLGMFSIGTEIANLPTSELSAPLMRAIYPGYAAIANQPDALSRWFRAIIGMLATAAIPAGLGIAAIAEPLVAVVLGAQWHDAAPVIRVMAFQGVLSALQANATYVSLATNRPSVIALIALVNAVALVALLAVLVPAGGALGAAWATLIAVAMSTPVALGVACRNAGLPISQLLRTLARPVLAGGVMYATVSWLAGVLGGSALVVLVELIGAGAAIYLAALVLLWALSGFADGPESYLLRRVQAWRQRERAP